MLQSTVRDPRSPKTYESVCDSKLLTEFVRRLCKRVRGIRRRLISLTPIGNRQSPSNVARRFLERQYERHSGACQ